MTAADATATPSASDDSAAVTGAAASTPLPVVAMLGGGNMNGAILSGLLASDRLPSEPIRVTTKSRESAAAHADEPRVRAFAVEEDAEANRRAVEGASVVVLGVKPYGIAAMLDEIHGSLDPSAVVISVAAGITTESMAAHLPEGARIVRAMPNTPASVGLGMTGIAAGTGADEEAMALARAVFETVGEVVEVDETLINGIGAVSGSGPAFVYLLAEKMIAGAEELGFDAETARTLVVQTVRGAAEMMDRQPDVTPGELRRRVTSPNGTTERSIAALEDGGIGPAVARAITANVERAGELADEYGSAAPASSASASPKTETA